MQLKVWFWFFQSILFFLAKVELFFTGLYHLSNKSLMKCRDEMLDDARVSLTRSILVCPPNLRWKILLVGARLELSVGAAGVAKARQLLSRAFAEVPVKSRSFKICQLVIYL